MAISPKDLLVLTKKDSKIVDKLEKAIERTLLKEHRGNGRASINLDFFASGRYSFLNNNIKNEFIRRYQSHGWDVEFSYSKNSRGDSIPYLYLNSKD